MTDNDTEPTASDDSVSPGDGLSDQLKAKLSQSALGAAAQERNLTGADLLQAIGGVRGLVETTLPPLVFLVVFFVTDQHLVLSVTIPLLIAALFIVIRIISKSELTSSISGMVGLGLSAALALFSGNLENNFLLGIVTNAALLLIFLISLALKYPVIGVLGAFLMEVKGWRQHRQQFRLMVIATTLWCLMFAIRLGIQLPLYLSENSAGLALAKVILGVPLYALLLWATWLLLRAAFLPQKSTELFSNEE